MQWHLQKFADLGVHNLYEILRIRMEVFMLEQTCLYAECDGKDQVAKHLFLESNGVCLAYARLIPPGIAYADCSAIGRVLVHRDYRSAGFGKELLTRAIAHLSTEHAGIPIRISAQHYLKDFYTDFGFLVESAVYLEDNIPHLEMVHYPK